MKSYNELRKMVFEKLCSLYGDKIPERIIERINNELEWIDSNNQSQFLLDIININNYLIDDYKEKYIFIGTIDEWYIPYLFGVTSVDPIEVNFHTYIKVNMLVKEGIMDDVVSKLNEHFNNWIKAVSTTSHEDFPFYHLLVIDHNNKLSTYERSKIRPTMPLRTKAKKNDLEDKYDFIRISQYISFDIKSELDKLDIEYPIFNMDNISNLKKSMLECNTLHKTRFEILLSKYDNLEELFFDNFNSIEKWKMEFFITWAKYNRSLTYYNIVIKYFNNHINKNLDIKAINNFMNDIDSAIKYYESKTKFKGEDYYPYVFFQLCHDIKNIFDKNFRFEIVNNEIVPIFYNITFYESIPLNGKMEVFNNLLLECLNNNRITSLYLCGGPTNWYISNLIARDTSMDRKIIETYLNPLKPNRYILDKEPLEKLDNKLLFDSIEKIRNSCLLMYNLTEMTIEDNLDYLLETIEESEIIIIDDLSIFMMNTKYTIDEVLNKLNELNKKVYIFDNLKGDYVRNHRFKRKYSRYIYTINKINDKIKIESVTSLQDKYILEA